MKIRRLAGELLSHFRPMIPVSDDLCDLAVVARSPFA